MRCYIDEPCEALQIQGMMASFFSAHENNSKACLQIKFHSVIWLEITRKVVYIV